MNEIIPIHYDSIRQQDDGYVVTCRCGRLEVWRATEARAMEAFAEHVEAECPGIFDEVKKKHQ